jgi:superfamily II DNA or RNA helicase
MNWRLSTRVDLRSPQISDTDARRQRLTAAEILRRFDGHPGQILADEVGMGKTFVALAVAASVIENTDGRNPVVVMVPPSVGTKWPLEWKKFASELKPGRRIRATDHTIGSGSEFLKLLDDPPRTRKHLIFLTHGALTNGLSDPYIRLAIVQRALRSKRLARQRRVFARWAERVIRSLANERLGEPLIERLLATSPQHWRKCIRQFAGWDPGDDPVPRAVLAALPHVDLTELRDILASDLPLHRSPNLEARLKRVRSALTTEVSEVWREGLLELDLDLPLLILDEAHHTKNPYTKLAGLFENQEARDEADKLRGELGGVFHRMLFLTATPFQLGHHELIEVLDRFTGVRWDDLDRDVYVRQLDELRLALDTSQAAALRLDRSWGRLSAQDAPRDSSNGWWADPEADSLSPAAQAAVKHWVDAREKAHVAERLLRRYVIRHIRPDRDRRRAVYCGAALETNDVRDSHGLTVEGPAVLPFLLAARAQSVVAAYGLRKHRAARAMFADGLASSFEAYTRTRSVEDLAAEIDDLPVSHVEPLPPEVTWYVGRISKELPADNDDALADHPKIAATVKRAVELWRQREKLLVFCFYKATGRALRRHIGKAIGAEIAALGAAQLELPATDPSVVHARLDQFRERLFDTDSPPRRLAREELRGALSHTLQGEDLDRCVDQSLRFLRTYSFLVRYLDLSRPPLDALRDAFETKDASGRTFREVVADFGMFMSQRQTEERERFLGALAAIEIGDIAVRDDEGEREQVIANVRLANGDTERQRRERLMVAFNTPFYPEVLVSSSVMAEGVDLHLMCRNVIHHDLDWNPSVIEQRTGRLDRIGSKAEVSGLPVQVYLPFIEGAQDEKQFWVMRDRERWFNVVMGERLVLDEASTDRLAERVPLPEPAAAAITMDLSVVR